MKAETRHWFRTSLNAADTSHFEPGANPATTPQTVYADATVQKQKHRLNNKATVNSVSKPAPRHHGKHVQTSPAASWETCPNLSPRHHGSLLNEPVPERGGRFGQSPVGAKAQGSYNKDKRQRQMSRKSETA